MPAKGNKLNLLPPSEFESSFWGKFIKWAVSTGRYLIIITEMVVIVAFLSRFKLDQDLADLNEEIKSQIAFLDSQEPIKEQFLKVQNKLVLAHQFYDRRASISPLYDYVLNNTPTLVTVTQLGLTKNDIKLSAATLSEQAMNQMLKAWSADQVWQNVDLSQIQTDPVGGTKFTLNAKK